MCPRASEKLARGHMTAAAAPASATPPSRRVLSASVGELGRWLTDQGDLESSALLEYNATTVLSVSFPSNWPAAFKESPPLKKLLNITLKGSRVRVVDKACETATTALTAAAAAGVRLTDLSPLHSFANAERISAALAWPVVVGYLVVECDEASAASKGTGCYLGWKHHWNRLPSGAWVDLTPADWLLGSGEGRPGATRDARVLLVETKRGEKSAAPLTEAGLAFAEALARQLGAAPREPLCEGPSFIASAAFDGKREGYAFRSGPRGMGYYRDGDGPDASAMDGASKEGDEDDPGAPAVAQLSSCNRCDGCGAPAAVADGASAAQAAKARGSALLRAGNAYGAAVFYHEACLRVPSTTEPAAHAALYSNLALALLKVHALDAAGRDSGISRYAATEERSAAAVHAATAARRCVDLSPTFAKGHYRLGQALLLSAQPARAVAALRAAVTHASSAEAAEVASELRKAEKAVAGHSAASDAGDDDAGDAGEAARLEVLRLFVKELDVESADAARALDGSLRKCADCGYAACVGCQADELRSNCRCEASNFGEAYADSTGPRAKMGAPGGKRYTGPFKCSAQIAMERKLTSVRPGWPRLERCSYYGCGAVLPASKGLMCAKCRSVVYCSKACAAAAWSGEPPSTPVPTPKGPTSAADEALSHPTLAAAMLDIADIDPEPAGGQPVGGQTAREQILAAEKAAVALAAQKAQAARELAKKLAMTASATGASNAVSAANAAELLRTLPQEQVAAAMAALDCSDAARSGDAAATGDGGDGEGGETAGGGRGAPVLWSAVEEDQALGPRLVANPSGHKHECDKHIEIEKLPYVSSRLRRYHDETRRYPTPMPTAEQLAPEYVPTGQMLMFPGGGCRWVDNDEHIPNPFTGGGGGGNEQKDPMPQAKR